MTMDSATANALANEARRQELRGRVARLQGEATSQASLATIISTTSSDTQRLLATATAELSALEAGAGPGVSDDFGAKADHLAAFITAAVAAGLVADEAAARELAGL